MVKTPLQLKAIEGSTELSPYLWQMAVDYGVPRGCFPSWEVFVGYVESVQLNRTEPFSYDDSMFKDMGPETRVPLQRLISTVSLVGTIS